METMTGLHLPNINEDDALARLAQNKKMQELLESPSPDKLILSSDGVVMTQSEIDEARSDETEHHRVGRY